MMHPPVGGQEEELEAWVKEAANELQPEDELSKETQKVLKALDIETAQEEEEPADEPDLVKEVDDAESLKDLKVLIKANNEFKSLRGTITKYKAGDEEDLKEAMFAALEPEKEKGKEEEKKPETKVIKMTPSGKEEVPIPKLKGKKEEPEATKEKETKTPTKKESKISQTGVIRDAILEKKKRPEIEKLLISKFDKSEGWAKSRMNLYEKAYGEMGKDDKKLK